MGFQPLSEWFLRAVLRQAYVRTKFRLLLVSHGFGWLPTCCQRHLSLFFKGQFECITEQSRYPAIMLIPLNQDNCRSFCHMSPPFSGSSGQHSLLKLFDVLPLRKLRMMLPSGERGNALNIVPVSISRWRAGPIRIPSADGTLAAKYILTNEDRQCPVATSSSHKKVAAGAE